MSKPAGGDARPGLKRPAGENNYLTRQCLLNLKGRLEAAGSSLEKVVSVTVVMADEEDFAGMNEEWLKWFPENPPARQGAKLPARIPGLKVSIAAIAEA